MLALIMAGGSGTRFWPKSRESHPKQLLQILDKSTMLQNTVDRLQPLIPPDRIFIVCKQIQHDEVSNQLPHIPAENIIVEPEGKNTAPCIGLGALHMHKRFGDEVMVVLPADHRISPEESFRQTLADAGRIASEHPTLITIGISPTFPATGYGYIQFSDERIRADQAGAWRVKTFAEKPNLETAKKFLESGDFLWNSGIFVWRISTILEQIEEYLPHLSDSLRKIEPQLGTPSEKETVAYVYRQIKSISVDYGIMENAENVAVLKANFEWSDVGSWDEVYKQSPKDQDENVFFNDDHIALDTSGCLIDVKSKLVATIGLENLAVIETDDALLICARDRAQEVKEVVENLKRKKKVELL